MRDRRLIIGLCACAALLALARHPTADVRILTHEATAPMPHEVKAAVDLGLIGISVLYTWTARPLS